MSDRLLWEIALAGYGAANLFFAAESGLHKKSVSAVAGALAACAAGCQLSALILRGMQTGRFPILDLYDALGLFAVLVLAAYFIVQWKWALKSLGFSATALAFLLTLLSFVFPDKLYQMSGAALSGTILDVHIVMILLSFSLLALAFCTALAYLTHDFALRQKHSMNLAKRFPPLLTLDQITNKLVGLGFILLSIGIALGSIWSERTWGTWWSLDPKESLALATWIVYALYIHARTLSGWKGRRSILLIVMGFALVLATFIGASFLPGKHHFV